MYIRFVSPVRLDSCRGHCGIFQSAIDIVYDNDTPEHIYLPLRELLDWFNTNLPKPQESVFSMRSCRKYIEVGICWFRDDAREMIRNAQVMAAILKECDIQIVQIATRNPGQLLYRDDYQIVAKPCSTTPVAWH